MLRVEWDVKLYTLTNSAYFLSFWRCYESVGIDAVVPCNTVQTLWHDIYYLLPPVKVYNSQMVLRDTYPYQLSLSKTVHCRQDFVPYSTS